MALTRIKDFSFGQSLRTLTSIKAPFVRSTDALLMIERPLIDPKQETILSLVQETHFAPNGIVSRVLLNSATVRVVLFGFAEGQELSEHTSTSQALIQILSDINMPGMTGLEMLPKVKAMRPEVPVIMITAYGDSETRRRVIENGATGLLTKPIDFGLLREEKIGRAHV